MSYQITNQLHFTILLFYFCFLIFISRENDFTLFHLYQPLFTFTTHFYFAFAFFSFFAFLFSIQERKISHFSIFTTIRYPILSLRSPYYVFHIFHIYFETNWTIIFFLFFFITPTKKNNETK